MRCSNCGNEVGQDANYCIQCGEGLSKSADNYGEQSKSTPAMKGRILAFDWRVSEGVISGDDGNRYQFTQQEWRSQDQPRPDVGVDFIPDGANAKDIYLWAASSTAGSNLTQSKRFIAGLLAILIGLWGIHKFYLGYKQEGIILLLAGTIGWILVIPGMVAVVVAIVEGVIYLTKTDAEFDQLYVQGHRPWF